MELNDTVTLMNSEDYKERFIAEYYQTKIRYDKLHKMIVKLEADKLDFEPKSPLYLLKEQAKYMGEYLRTLEIRAEIEDIDLEWKPEGKVEKIEIKLKSCFDKAIDKDDIDKDIEKFAKDLEEMLNDITEKRES